MGLLARVGEDVPPEMLVADERFATHATLVRTRYGIAVGVVPGAESTRIHSVLHYKFKLFVIIISLTVRECPYPRLCGVVMPGAPGMPTGALGVEGCTTMRPLLSDRTRPLAPPDGKDTSRATGAFEYDIPDIDAFKLSSIHIKVLVKKSKVLI